MKNIQQVFTAKRARAWMWCQECLCRGQLPLSLLPKDFSWQTMLQIANHLPKLHASFLRFMATLESYSAWPPCSQALDAEDLSHRWNGNTNNMQNSHLTCLVLLSPFEPPANQNKQASHPGLDCIKTRARVQSRKKASEAWAPYLLYTGATLKQYYHRNLANTLHPVESKHDATAKQRTT